jgi:hypothetical protein
VRTVLVAIVFLTAIYAVAEAQQPPASAKKPSPFQQAVDDIEEARKSPATTDAAQSSKQCFDIVMPPRGGQSIIANAGDSILLNRCTGDTWLLVKTSAGKTGNNFVYRWYPLKTGSDEAVLGP